MRWFKHVTNARADEFLTILADGSARPLEIYGFFWNMVEAIGGQMDRSEKCSVVLPTTAWIRETRCRNARQFHAFLTLFSQKHPLMPQKEPPFSVKILSENSGNVGETLEIKCRNILKYRDEYSKKSGQAPDSLQSNSGLTPDKGGGQCPAETEAQAQTEAQSHPPYPPQGQARREPSSGPPTWTRDTEAVVFKLRGLGCPESDDTIIRHLKTALCSGLTAKDIMAFLNTGGHQGKHVWAIVQAVHHWLADIKRTAQQAQEIKDRRDASKIVEAERKAIDAYLTQACPEEIEELKATAITNADEKQLTGAIRKLFLDSSMRAEALRRAQAADAPPT